MASNVKFVVQGEIEPDYEGGDPPKSIKTTGRRGDILYVAGKGEPGSDIMFIAPAAEEEETLESNTSAWGVTHREKAEYLKGPVGNMFRSVALQAGIDLDKQYYTALCKWLLPKVQRTKPSNKAAQWGEPALLEEIKRVDPKVIICLGKTVYDALTQGKKRSQKNAHGCWNYSEKVGKLIYLMDPPSILLMKPDKFETLRTDLKEVKRKLMELAGEPYDDLEVRTTVIENSQDLRDWVDSFRNGEREFMPVHCPHRDRSFGIMSVDCEWHGSNHTVNHLRSLQIAWNKEEAVYIRFMDDQLNYVFDVDYREAGFILSDVCDNPDNMYIAHHWQADSVQLSYHLGLQVIGRCFMDTEFAEQTVDENADLSLTRLAMKRTTFGRYEQDLIDWKEKNRALCVDGYGFIPDDIIIPYGIRDVLAPMRALEGIMKQLILQNLWEYYVTIHNPFVTDVFTEFTLHGLPMDIPQMEDLRRVFNYSRERLMIKFRSKMVLQAKEELLRNLKQLCLEPGFGKTEEQAQQAFDQAMAFVTEEEMSVDGLNILKEFAGPKHTSVMVSCWEHLQVSPVFNINSSVAMRRWLFDVCGYEPIKSTNKKAEGMPSMAWEAVMELPAERRKKYQPATDKQTLEILAEQNKLLAELLDMKAVANLCKAFLKEAEVTQWVNDEGETEEEVKEAGLFRWISPETGRIHGMNSCTDTARPRSWNPNTLNWPGFVNQRISVALVGLLIEEWKQGILPEDIRDRWLRFDEEGKIKLNKWGDPDVPLPSIRSCVKSEPGMMLVESDYQTAEVRGLAFISNDENLIRLMTGFDPCFGYLEADDEVQVRIAYADFQESGIPESAQNPDFLMSIASNGKISRKVEPQELARDENGNIKNPRYDLHWSLAEYTYGLPRECMHKKIERQGAGKVGNFSSMYGATASSLERKIEADTGVKPEEGTGQKILDALRMRQPRATEWLEEMQELPSKVGLYTAASGKKRHFHTHGSGSGVSYRMRNSIESAQGRQARNFPMQESVGATAARAAFWLNTLYERLGLENTKVMTVLYDSVVTHCPIEYRWVVRHLHNICMYLANVWYYPNDDGTWRELKYPIDNEFLYRWSTSTTKEEKEQLFDPEWKPTPEHLRYILDMDFGTGCKVA